MKSRLTGFVWIVRILVFKNLYRRLALVEMITAV